MSQRHLNITLAAAAMTVAGSAFAQTTTNLLNNQFTGLSNGTGASSQGYFTVGTTVSSTVQSEALNFPTTNTVSFLVKSFTNSNVLTNIGDSISLTFSFTPASLPSTQMGLRFGLYANNGSPVTTAGGNNNSVSNTSNWSGYAVGIGTGGNTGARIWEESGGGGATGNGLTNTGDLTTQTVTASYGTSLTTSSMELRLTLTSAAGVTIAAYKDSTLLTSFEDTSGRFSFNSLAIGVGGTAYSMTLDNIAVDFTAAAVPEPSSFAALAGLGMLGFAATRRRRR